MIKFRSLEEAQRYADSGVYHIGNGLNWQNRRKVIRSRDGRVYVAELTEVRPSDEIIPPDAWIVTCGLCGAEDWMCPRVEESWHPIAYRGDEDVSPVCPRHAGHYDPAEHAFSLDQ